MDLGLSNGGGAYIRFSPSVNSWTVDGEEVSFTQCLVDPTSIRTGWGHIEAGMQPDWVWDETPGQRSRAPTQADGGVIHKRGFSVFLYVKGHGWREWATTSAGANMGIQAVWPQVAAGAAENPGKVGVLDYKGSTAAKVGKGNTRLPQFVVAKWIDDPEGERPAVTVAFAAQSVAAQAVAEAPKAQSAIGKAEF